MSRWLSELVNEWVGGWVWGGGYVCVSEFYFWNILMASGCSVIFGILSIKDFIAEFLVGDFWADWPFCVF